MPPHSNAREEVARHKQANVMLARVAGSLYWMSRYLERAENQARLIDVNLQLLLDFGEVSDEQLKAHWLPIVRSSGDEEQFLKLYDVADSESVTEFMTFRLENPNSLASCIANARENARQVRDQISSEMWEVLNDAHHFIQGENAKKIWHEGASAFYDQIKRYSHLFQGITVSTFSRSEGFEFIQFGKYLERADQMTRLLDIKYHILLPTAADVGGAVDTAQWHAVLRSASAVEAYRRYYVADVYYKKVVEFLLFDDCFPRTMRFCGEEMAHFIDLITSAAPETDEKAPAIERFMAFLDKLSTLDVEDIFNQGLHEFLDMAQVEIGNIGGHMYSTYMYFPPIDMQAEIRFQQQQEQQQQ
jgi:uncharacterized alpha-E superfamily protein